MAYMSLSQTSLREVRAGNEAESKEELCCDQKKQLLPQGIKGMVYSGTNISDRGHGTYI